MTARTARGPLFIPLTQQNPGQFLGLFEEIDIFGEVTRGTNAHEHVTQNAPGRVGKFGIFEKYRATLLDGHARGRYAAATQHLSQDHICCTAGRSPGSSLNPFRSGRPSPLHLHRERFAPIGHLLFPLVPSALSEGGCPPHRHG